MSQVLPGMWNPPASTVPSETGSLTVTAVLVDKLRAADLGESESVVLDRAVAHVLSRHRDGGWVDSHQVAEAFVARRTRVRDGGETVDWTQTKDYVQHLFRNADHVCGHGVDARYRIHPEPECSPACKARRAWSRTVVEKKPMCLECFIELPATGVCDCQL